MSPHFQIVFAKTTHEAEKFREKFFDEKAWSLAELFMKKS